MGEACLAQKSIDKEIYYKRIRYRIFLAKYKREEN